MLLYIHIIVVLILQYRSLIWKFAEYAGLLRWRRKKNGGGSLHYALEVCDRGQLTTIISTKSDLDGKASLEVLNCIKKSREVFNDKMSPLQGAVTLGHMSICRHLVEEGAVLRSASGIPHPLCLALQKGHLEIASLLINAGANVNLAFGEILPIAFALESGKCTKELIQLIIDSGFPKDGIVNRVTERTVLHVAARKNLLSIAEFMLVNFSADPNRKDCKGLTPLHYAVQCDNTEMIEMLVKNGAKLDCECNDNLTPLFYAIASGSSKIVKLLISLGSDIHHVNGSKKCSMMPLHFAATICQLKITKVLLEKGADVNRKVPMTGEIALHAAARADIRNGQQSDKISLDCIVELLVKQGSDLQARHRYGLTPLQVAIKSKNLSIAKILITSGSELNNVINEDEERSYTTFHLAAKLYDKELTKMFFDYGADCMVKDDENLYPCHLALLTSVLDSLAHSSRCTVSNFCCDFKHLSLFKLFWKHGFPFDLTLKMNWLGNTDNPPYPLKITHQIKLQTQLFSGIKSQHLNSVSKAISQGAEVKCCSTEIPYPVHFIASKGNKNILKLLLSRGALVNNLDTSGETPLHIAARGGFLDCCQILLEYGAVYNYTSSKCPKTPLQVAQDKGHTEVASLLTSIDKHFKAMKKGYLKKTKPDMIIFIAVMNCCNRDGMSLMGMAIKMGLKEKAERLMKLRLSYLRIK